MSLEKSNSFKVVCLSPFFALSFTAYFMIKACLQRKFPQIITGRTHRWSNAVKQRNQALYFKMNECQAKRNQFLQLLNKQTKKNSNVTNECAKYLQKQVDVHAFVLVLVCTNMVY